MTKRSKAALKAWDTRRSNARKAELVARAVKAVKTKDRNGLNWSKVALDAWVTRRRNARKISSS